MATEPSQRIKLPKLPLKSPKKGQPGRGRLTPAPGKPLSKSSKKRKAR